MNRQSRKLIQEGEYLAEVEVELIERPDPRRHTREDGTLYGGY